ncbi:MAG TPA: hypothetical protein PLQ36_02880, partial [Candidatus Gracilibacteria bacterium]|nr:hypothetical protein [Candidatus Gracilibacteria bacterium]
MKALQQFWQTKQLFFWGLLLGVAASLVSITFVAQLSPNWRSANLLTGDAKSAKSCVEKNFQGDEVSFLKTVEKCYQQKMTKEDKIRYQSDLKDLAIFAKEYQGNKSSAFGRMW